jgi:hypothetical protein
MTSFALAPDVASGVISFPMILRATATFSFTFTPFGGYLYPSSGGEQTG